MRRAYGCSTAALRVYFNSLISSPCLPPTNGSASEAATLKCQMRRALVRGLLEGTYGLRRSSTTDTVQLYDTNLEYLFGRLDRDKGCRPTEMLRPPDACSRTSGTWLICETRRSPVFPCCTASSPVAAFCGRKLAVEHTYDAEPAGSTPRVHSQSHLLCSGPPRSHRHLFGGGTPDEPYSSERLSRSHRSCASRLSPPVSGTLLFSKVPGAFLIRNSRITLSHVKLIVWPTGMMKHHESTLPRQADQCQADPAVQRVEIHRWLTDAILALPEPERLIFALHHYERLTLEEIELLLGETRDSVSQSYASAVLHLQSETAFSGDNRLAGFFCRLNAFLERA